MSWLVSSGLPDTGSTHEPLPSLAVVTRLTGLELPDIGDDI
jgi:hypothetical protein